MNSQKSTFVGKTPTPSNLPAYRRSGNSHIFYKTRMCRKFEQGICRNGDNCTYAHGRNDLRKPPPNWEEHVKDNRGGNQIDDHEIIQRKGICKMFYNGNQCTYGDKCTFVHESPAKFRVQAATDKGESSVIKIQPVVDHGPESQLMADQASNKYHFAPGIADLQPSAGRGPGGYVAASTVPGPMITSEPPAPASGSGTSSAVPRIGRGFLKLSNKKLSGIYADWITEGEDDMIH